MTCPQKHTNDALKRSSSITTPLGFTLSAFTFTQRVKLDLIIIDQMSIGTIGSISKGANEEKVVCNRLYH